jgi:hypothetical protein
MRYLIDIAEGGTVTHVVAYNSVVEHTEHVRRRYTGPNPPTWLSKKGHPRTGDWFYDRTDRTADSEDDYRTDHEAKRAEWLGRTDLHDWDDLCRAVVTPWPKGEALVASLRRQLEGFELGAPRSIRRRSEWSDNPGGTFDLDRFLDAQPYYRGPVPRHVVARQFVTLFVDACASRTMDAAQMYWRGVTAAVVAEKLEAAGYSVEIVVYDVGNDALLPNPALSGGRMQDLVVSVWVKRFEDPLDTGAIVVASSPWYFRIAMFATFHLIPGETIEPEYGTVGTLDKSIRTHFTTNEDAYTIEAVWSLPGAVRAARRILENFGDPVGLVGAAGGAEDRFNSSEDDE